MDQPSLKPLLSALLPLTETQTGKMHWTRVSSEVAIRHVGGVGNRPEDTNPSARS